jgi:hypothetical protein
MGPFPRIAFTKGEDDGILFESLHAHALEHGKKLQSAAGCFVDHHDGNTKIAMSTTHVLRVTYKDADGDSCFVCSNADLIQALLQCQTSSASSSSSAEPGTLSSNNSSLKMFAMVSCLYQGPNPFDDDASLAGRIRTRRLVMSSLLVVVVVLIILLLVVVRNNNQLQLELDEMQQNN